ncbi:hypothetical protein FMM05_19200 [Flavobacterium zepuense]|uniref:Uncharacterized protein n=1 Tax=Flavobacterium zepuense TaxID=2593302 RepID=A0A552UV55_9FLAO|nr:hypothetical protein FMM05_19200 [Flavobacterium zepuense]
MVTGRKSRYETQKSPIQRFLFVLGIVFFLLYLVLGFMLIFTNRIPLNITYNGKLILGILLIVYGSFRFIRAWQNYKS